MGRRSINRKLHVAMNGDPVATLTHSPRAGLRLTYVADWLEREDAIPISLSLPLSSEPFGGSLVSNYFDNLLPDNVTIRERMQRTLRTGTTAPFDLLSAAGADCVGALQLSQQLDMKPVRAVTATPVAEPEIARILRGYRQYPLGMIEDDDFRISIAGAQEKTALLKQDGSWFRPRGTTPTTHIFKLPLGRVHEHVDLTTSVYNEWLCLAL
ncbi:MAG: HipA N-terminal domain-containing protein, partial [Deltaproteobacteria bacterium]|nr:HipA N-terminal domain-containing protein [Deltaproteobacteria bacterium]